MLVSVDHGEERDSSTSVEDLETLVVSPDLPDGE